MNPTERCPAVERPAGHIYFFAEKTFGTFAGYRDTSKAVCGISFCVEKDNTQKNDVCFCGRRLTEDFEADGYSS